MQFAKSLPPPWIRFSVGGLEPLGCWFGLVAWVFEALVLAEGRWVTSPAQATKTWKKVVRTNLCFSVCFSKNLVLAGRTSFGPVNKHVNRVYVSAHTPKNKTPHAKQQSCKTRLFPYTTVFLGAPPALGFLVLFGSSWLNHAGRIPALSWSFLACRR